MTPEEAQESLHTINQITAQTRKTLYQQSGYFPIIWGIVWAGGFLSYQFLPFSIATILWIALLMVGGIISGIVGARVGQKLHSTNGTRISLFFVVLMGYTYLWLWIAHPLRLPQMELLISLAVLFGMIALGLWIRVALLIVFGVVVSILALVGYYTLLPYFGLWMAGVIGSTFVGSGIYHLRYGR